jgi:carbon-monoxide dehydrogenase medium subunit
VIDFEYHAPKSLAEALDLLDRYGDDARVMAGGTALVLQMKQRLSQPGHVVALRNIPGLRSIDADVTGQELHLGPLCTLRQIETDPVVQEKQPLVATAFGQVSTPRIRSMATVGGALVHGDPNQDPPPALIAMGASAVMTSSQGQRTAPLAELFVDYYETDVRPGEILTSLVIPSLPAGWGSVYLKFLPRTADDYATVSVAAAVAAAENNTCADVRIVLGSVGVTPVRATQAEAWLRGQHLDEANLRGCAELVRDEVDPLDDFRGSAEYKREMAEVFTRRALQQAVAARLTP